MEMKGLCILWQPGFETGSCCYGSAPSCARAVQGQDLANQSGEGGGGGGGGIAVTLQYVLVCY